ncbi:MAG: glycosyltransferase family 2 protein [Tannerella sp.]|jgi:glycosyltransferase involved in cell wall biosynthesis|nr:glycosyltransferase family 2 protein [Tannerella sp.]
MYKNKRVSVILPTYNEKDSIKKVIEDFFSIKDITNDRIVDEIIVINNNAKEGTSEEVAKTKAKEIMEPVQGYGAAIQRGFMEASGDLLVVCEPDDTFIADDIIKLLSYSDDVDIVYGSRTVNHFIWTGANMGWFLRWGNWAVAKMIEILFNTNYLSDVGCTFRLISRNALIKIQDKFLVRSNFFGPEMMVRGFLMKMKCVQIPVNYKSRVGESSVIGNFFKAFKLGIQMIILVLSMRFRLEKKIIKLMQ